MSLTAAQIKFAFDQMANELVKSAAVTFTKSELKQAIQDAEAWAETPAVKADFNANLTNGNFKTNATSDQKRMALIVALMSIIRA